MPAKKMSYLNHYFNCSEHYWPEHLDIVRALTAELSRPNVMPLFFKCGSLKKPPSTFSWAVFSPITNGCAYNGKLERNRKHSRLDN